MENNQEALRQAKAYAFLLLKFRLRSRNELYNRLKKKKFPEIIINQALSFLEERNFINDRDFAARWAQQRLSRPFGIRRIKQELRLKGIEDKIINSLLADIKDKYCEEELVRKITKEKLDKLKDVEPLKAKRRVYAYLLRRGFSSDIVMDSLRQLYER
ncbi:MAG TPA: regulatory protein RecX [Candidatus Omnitrophota bacterium]|nr:regulatory protein RecX [Candidatus Omnitrophota bacterium]